MITISSLKNGTNCHGYVTNCRKRVMFDRGMRDCSGTCLVSERHNIPSNHSYCPHMSILGTDNKVREAFIDNVTESGCYKVSGNSDKFTLKEIKCPKKLPKLCGEPNWDHKI
ncbi:hypothetical protein F8M41_019215 [Gigaspora margarita]|uniref:Uncharacterized protein n=1 Tax=Gigaspora margarita TaxID=4874 RepID=A0A8H4AKC7_GIGMA|nr:hypothetical protein F8M41_019215 [Gigaspora margarita]